MKFHWVKRRTRLHTHLRASGLWRWFVWLRENHHEEICKRVRSQTHDHKLTDEEVHAIAATHQAHTRRWRWLLPALLLLLAPGLHAQGTINVIPQKQFQDAVNHAFNVTCVSGCSAAATFLDNGAFTASVTPVSIMAGWFSSSPTACTSGSACAPSLTSDRKLFVQSFQGTSPWVVSGTVTTTPPSNASTNVAQWAGNTLGATSNYGTSPGTVAVPGVNAFITNTPAVTLTSTTITGTVAATQSGTWTVQPGNTANSTAWLVNWTAAGPVTQSGTWTNRVVGNTGATLDAASGAALPTNTFIAAGRDSTQTGGGTAIPVICDKSAFINPTTATTTQIVALSGSTIVYVCGYTISNGATAQTVILKFGTGAACATGTTSLTGTYSLAVNSSITFGGAIGSVARTTAGQALCGTTSGASTTTSITVTYAQF